MEYTKTSTDADDELSRAEEFADRFIDEHSDLFDKLANE
ncbi:hypothetical protein Hlac_3216 [Halorubrum lacusprofundi ATCC 49239]|jgi:hypothetical protein|uniref:Uncharacterized protein n=1 Tax=Halorubrum lacusprofundi (strain ATCC 49239 / DSM 5036 / JCM 8891 / ACAM 34) TaxID=416348 RepID=B9LVN6_HALLT|nr:hypothetical protein Hlac_3216 [Halorubrum lacusprofundi ATCC 49239]